MFLKVACCLSELCKLIGEINAIRKNYFIYACLSTVSTFSLLLLADISVACVTEEECGKQKRKK